ncbi:hypothetical protein TgHK011_002824 [Trichoderma gracile]|nr:hypothetical protein TgHK011_002824 [Trichoderma gracile]
MMATKSDWKPKPSSAAGWGALKPSSPTQAWKGNLGFSPDKLHVMPNAQPVEPANLPAFGQSDLCAKFSGSSVFQSPNPLTSGITSYTAGCPAVTKSTRHRNKHKKPRSGSWNPIHSFHHTNAMTTTGRDISEPLIGPAPEDLSEPPETFPIRPSLIEHRERRFRLLIQSTDYCTHDSFRARTSFLGLLYYRRLLKQGNISRMPEYAGAQHSSHDEPIISHRRLHEWLIDVHNFPPMRPAV